MNDSNHTRILLESCRDNGPPSDYYYVDFHYPREPNVFKDLEASDYVKILAYSIMIIGGLFGNISVILTVALNRSMRTTINYYVANLAVADSMICVVCMGPTLVATLTYPHYPLGAFMCKFNTFMQMSCLTCSVLTLSAISCDRFMAIMFPLHVRITKQRTSVFMCIIWIISFLVSTPFLLVKHHYSAEFINFVESKCGETWPIKYTWNPVNETCQKTYPLRIVYYTTVAVTLYILPVVIMITAYSLILWKLWISEVPGERHAANINVQGRARKKVIKMVMVVLIAFILCWTPFEIWLLEATFATAEGQLGEDHFKFYSHFFAFSNSFLNPIIYGGFNKTFREGFCIMLRCGCRRNRFTRPPRSRLTFTTGITSSPSRPASKIINGNKSSQKSNIEMRPIVPQDCGDISPTMKDTCVSIMGSKDSVALA